MVTDEQYMQRCLELAAKGLASVAPNPMVGSVVVYKDQIIGEGYHEKYGGPHAEVNAINAVADKSLLPLSTIYVNLEPCAHHGKTPPCADLIIEKKIGKVMIGTIDTFAKVSGLGIKKLKDAGCKVTTGVLEKECLELNKRFFSFHSKGRPYVILKWAQSADGYLDIKRSSGQKGTHWISQEETKTLVHKWRSEESAILIGKNTLLNDNPSLTVRKIEGNSPTRFVVAPNTTLNLENFNLGKTPPTTIIIDESEISKILDVVQNHNCLSVMVEGGAFTLNKFISSGLWDEARVISGINNLGDGLKAPNLNNKAVTDYHYGEDHIQIYLND